MCVSSDVDNKPPLAGLRSQREIYHTAYCNNLKFYSVTMHALVYTIVAITINRLAGQLTLDLCTQPVNTLTICYYIHHNA